MPEYSISQNEKIHCSNLKNGFLEIEQPIPDINTDSKTDSKLFVQELFEKFWHNYPLKIGKKTAKASFFRILKNKKEPEARMLMNLMLSYHFSQIELGAFGADKLHPTTFLNQERWNDSPDFINEFKQQWIADHAETR